MTRRLVCFDLDGTLLDPAGSIRDAIGHAIATERLPAFAPGEVLIGKPLREILRTRSTDEAQVERMVQRFRARYLDHGWTLAFWYPGVREVVAGLRTRAATAIVTTKGEHEASGLMDRIGASGLWDTIVGDDDVRPLKPDPAPVLEACRRVGVRPAHTVMVGDTRYDVEAGRAAGTYTIGVAWGTGAAWDAGPEGADVIVADAPALRRTLHDWLPHA
jgi:phosphoglycolate phosphatase